MKPGETLAWALLAAGALGLSLRMAGPPSVASPPPPPPARPRPPSEAERAQVQAQQAALIEDLSQARARLGSWPVFDRLEGPLPDGLPALARGLPDSPLRPGIAVVHARCPPLPVAEDTADWLYCEATGQLQAVGLTEFTR